MFTENKIAIMANDGMSKDEMFKMASGWTTDNVPICVYDIIYGKDLLPDSGRAHVFCENEMDDFTDYMAGISLTHRIMFVSRTGGIFVTEATDGNTNIDADIIEACFAGFKR